MAISLHLNYNYRPDISHELVHCVGNYEEVDELYMKDCRLLEISSWVYQLRNLVHLSVANNFLKEIDDLKVLVHLEYLDASNNVIEILQENFFELINLKSLDLSGNRIKILPDRIENLKQLEVLIFDRNHLHQIPESLTRCNKLILMAFEFCIHLTKIPANLFRMKSLEHLSLKCCNLNFVPSNISLLMKTLILKGNKLINNLPYSYRRFLEDINHSDFFLIEPDCMAEFTKNKSEHLKSSSAIYMSIGNTLINLPSNISKIYRATENSSVSLTELTLRNVRQSNSREPIPKVLEVSLNEPSAVCNCGTFIFTEAFLMVFYDKDHPSYRSEEEFEVSSGHKIGVHEVPWSELLCSKICCDSFLKKNLNNSQLIF